MKLLPLIGYMEADPESTSYQLEKDTRIRRFWTLVKWRPAPMVDSIEEQPWQTSEFCVKLRSINDFCGGMHVFSPQVFHYDRNSWHGEQFCNPGTVPSLGSLAWRVLETAENRAVDLAEFTGQEYWTTGEVKDYGIKCIAQMALSELISRGTHGWSATDHEGGVMESVHLQMIRLSGEIVPVGAPVFYSRIHESIAGNKCGEYQSALPVEVVDTTGDSFFNTNSGNSVSMLNGYWIAIGAMDRYEEVECGNCGHQQEYEDGTCYECGDDLCSENTVRRLIPEAARSCYNNPAFIKQARRYEWSNG